MRQRFAFACVGMALLPVIGSAQVELRQRGDRVDLVATGVPLSDLLQRLARETGMKVVYEGAPPRTLLTVSLLDRTPAEAVLGLFEGLGLNYAVSFDRSGTRIDTLLLAGAAGPGTSVTRAPAGQPIAGVRSAPVRPQLPSRGAREDQEERDEPADDSQPTEEQAEAPAEPPPVPSPAAGTVGPLPAPGQPGSPFDFKPRPLTFPTPVPPGAASPAPSPSPSPSPQS
ncbi:MAG: hypothetical protein AB7O37_22690 [Vicinamibacteria bacterium]